MSAAGDRRFVWLLRYMKGETNSQIAKSAGMSAQIVSQALRRVGVDSHLWNIPFLRRAIPAAARKAYSTQKCAAASRGIEWGFTIEEWWAVWQASGKWSERGKGGAAYVMARTGDFGPYAPGNVRVCRMSDNMKEHRANVSAALGLLKQIRHGQGASFR